MSYDFGLALERAFFHINLCTYENLSLEGEIVSEFVKGCLRLVERSGIPLRYVMSRDLSLGGQKRRGRQLNERSWQKLSDELLSGKTSHLLIFNDFTPAQGLLPEQLVKVSLTMRAVNQFDAMASRVKDPGLLEKIRLARRPAPQFLNFAINLRDTGLELDLENLQSIIAVTQKTFIQINGACGFLNMNRYTEAGLSTADEIKRGQHWTSQPEMMLTKLRGIFWANLLSPRHVELLGGFLQIQREAPCFLVQPLEFNAEKTSRSPGAYLQLTEHPSSISPEQIAALKQYLSPLIS